MYFKRALLFLVMSAICLPAFAQTEGGPAPEDPSPQVHPTATTYSDAYQARLKIHKYASYATLPLFATELALGQSLYNNPDRRGATKTLHGVVGTGIVGLFGVNTVTGVWNMWESRHDPEKRAIRWTHGILMLVADGGFVATMSTTPHNRRIAPGVVTVDSNRALHRNLAVGSIGVATASYLLMLFGGR